MPVNSGVRMENTDAAKPFARYLAKQRYVGSDGWAMQNPRRGTTNDQGFANSPDFGGRNGVFVVGDSYIESFMLDYPETLQGRLDAALGGNVHAAGASGNGLADELQIARFYAPRLGPGTMVFFVEPFDLAGLIDPPDRGHNGFSLAGGQPSIAHSAYRESPLKRVVQASALLRYIYYNLKIADWLSQTYIAGPPADGKLTRDHLGEKEKLLGYYFAEIMALSAATPARVLFLVDGDRGAIYAGKRRGKAAWNRDERQLFLRLAARYGLEVLDMQPVFERHWRQRHERMDFLPTNGHWNAVAHQLAADEVLKRLIAKPPLPSP